jgi:hypothetical protein
LPHEAEICIPGFIVIRFQPTFKTMILFHL